MTGKRKIEIEEKTRQNTENKQTFDLTRKIEIEGENSSNLSKMSKMPNSTYIRTVTYIVFAEFLNVLSFR